MVKQQFGERKSCLLSFPMRADDSPKTVF